MKFRMSSCVCSYHVYQHVWDAVVGENLECERETSNKKSRYTIVAKKAETTIGHLPKEVSQICSLFFSRGGRVVATVTGRQRYSADLVQGGLEIRCILTFSGKVKEIKKLHNGDTCMSRAVLSTSKHSKWKHKNSNNKIEKYNVDTDS